LRQANLAVGQRAGAKLGRNGALAKGAGNLRRSSETARARAMIDTADLPKRFAALDGWRGVCAVLVALHHFSANGTIAALPLIRNAWLFVDFFFVLSGFVISHAYFQKLGSRHEIGSFAWRRFARLWPLHVAVLGAFVVLELVRLAMTGSGFTGERAPFAIVANLFLVQSLGIFNGLTWNTPSWSISTEFYTYLVFAAACAATAKQSLRVMLSIALAVTGLAVLVLFSRYGMRETFGWGFFRCLFGFFAGSLTYDMWKRGWLRGGTAAEVATVAMALAFLVLVPGHRALEYFAVPVFALLVWVFAHERGVVSRAMRMHGVAALGRWSYPIYMVHMLVLAVFFSAVDSAGTGWTAKLPGGAEEIVMGNRLTADGLMLVYLAGVVALSAFTWRFIERPGRRVLGGLLDDRLAPAARRKECV
jgi:peptidoglycan/LPS O-acetylase OafA/YrhL